MITVQINEKNSAGKRILKEIAENPKAGYIPNPYVERDKESKVLNCVSVEEYISELRKETHRLFEKKDTCK